MTRSEAAQFMKQLEIMFDRVRLVDAAHAAELSFGADGEVSRRPCRCRKLWEREQGCAGCICMEVLREKRRVSRFEPASGEIYYVTGAYVEVEGEPLTVEAVSAPGGSGAFSGQTDAGSRDESFYLDSVTRIYNRRYYEEQLKDLEYEAVGILDVDGFGSINRSYGFAVGDQVLHEVADVLLACVRDIDAVVRYGGDEFLIIFCSIPRERLRDRLEDIREAVAGISLPDHPFLRISASIGGFYCAGEDPSRAVWEAGRLLCEAKLSGDCVKVEQEE